MNDVRVSRSALGHILLTREGVVGPDGNHGRLELWLTPEQGAELARQLVAAIDEVGPSQRCLHCGGWTCSRCKGAL